MLINWQQKIQMKYQALNAPTYLFQKFKQKIVLIKYWLDNRET